MKKLVVGGKVVLGRLTLDNKNYFRHHLKKFDGAVHVIIEKKQYKRSLKQNSLYWAFVEIISLETGNVKEDLHDYFKSRYAPRRFIKVGQREIQLAKSTATMTKGEMAEYMFHVENEAIQLGITLPKDIEEWERYRYNEANGSSEWSAH